MSEDSWQAEDKPSAENKNEISELQTGAPQTLVILKPKSDSLKSSETFLRHRKWIVISSKNIREVLAGIIQKRPKFVMIAADHPGKKTKMLPNLLMQALGCRVIGYCESTSTLAVNALNGLGLEYNLYPPISGPAIERMINKIIKDDETKKNSPSQDIIQAGKNSANGSQTQIISSGSSSAEEQAILQAKTALSQLMNFSDTEETPATSPAYMPDHNENSLPENDGSIIQKGATGQKFQMTEESTAGNTTKLNLDLSKESLPSYSLLQQNDNERSSQNYYDQIEEVVTQTKKPKLSPEDLNVIQQATTEALDKTSAAEFKSQNIQWITNTTSVACIAIESTKFNGYLIAAMGNNQKIDENFFAAIKERLFAFLKSHGDIPNEDSDTFLDLQIREVEFEGWALDQAEFLKKTVHGSDEIAMAFFPSEETQLKLEKSVSESMFKVSLKELKGDARVEFDLYIYLPENQKFLLYVPEGNVFFSHKKDRLIEKGVSHMHLRKESAIGVKRYLAQNFLNEKIAAYYQSKKS